MFKGLRHQKFRDIQVDVKSPQVDYRNWDRQVEFVSGDPIFVKKKK